MAVESHYPKGTIMLAAAVHFALAAPNWFILGTMEVGMPLWHCILDDYTEVISGFIVAPTRAGLYNDLNKRVARRYSYK